MISRCEILNNGVIIAVKGIGEDGSERKDRMNLKKMIVSGLIFGLWAVPLAGTSLAAAPVPTPADIAAAEAAAAAARESAKDPIKKLQEELDARKQLVKEYSLNLDVKKYTVQTMQVNGQAVKFRAYEDRVYVKYPVDADYEAMNIYIPDAYFSGESVNGYTAKTAPIFLPNIVGGYMPGEAGTPSEQDRHGGANAILMALSRGYVVAAPAIRGRTLQTSDGIYTGKAPALIVDYKAAVRYLRYNKDRLPAGDTEKIISDGTSAGGALSALLGATGNSPDYAPYLAEIGAATERDDIFASMVYCPITNLEHADMAYEWIFNGVNDYHQRAMGPAMPGTLNIGGRKLPLGPGPVILPEADAAGEKTDRPENAPTESTAASALSEEQAAASAELKAMFPAYVNSLGLKDKDGKTLTLDAAGNGSFRDYVASFYIASAQGALDSGLDLTALDWLTIEDSRVTGMDFAKYAVYATRLKSVPAFDSFDLSAAENDEFGTQRVKASHFTPYALQHSTAGTAMADSRIVKLLNPMEYIAGSQSTVAKHWRIRHGAIDRDTSIAVPALLAAELTMHGAEVDFASPWNRGHDGDYDLTDSFNWADQLCRAK